MDTGRTLLQRIFRVSSIDLGGTIVDIESTATPQRYRLISCIDLIESGDLTIYECAQLSDVAYSAISYVWRGNPVDPAFSFYDEYGTFNVKGAEDGDPISVDVLMHICTASLLHKIEYFWLDRLCIMQTNRDDKAWQISNMFNIYASCSHCLIIPGGVRRLVHLDEQTDWIHRAWTLQEAVVPKKSFVIFVWELGSGYTISGGHNRKITEVVRHRSAMTDLATIINACVTGELVFGGNSPLQSMDLQAAYTVKAKTTIISPPSPNLSALAICIDEVHMQDPDARGSAIWQSALMRTSSRPIDMVFSIMGLFSVFLDVKAFGKEERLRATAALAREILRHGGSASWLGPSLRLPLCRQLSTFPEFPKTTVSGKAYISTPDGPREVSNLLECEYPMSGPLNLGLPQGMMDEDGYFIFTRKAAYAIQHISESSIPPDDETLVVPVPGLSPFRLCKDEPERASDWTPRSFAVLLNWFQVYVPGISPLPDRNIVCILVQEHSPDRFHVLSAITLSSDFNIRKWVLSWNEYQFALGGPDKLMT